MTRKKLILLPFVNTLIKTCLGEPEPEQYKRNYLGEMEKENIMSK